jgi:MFS family permease
LEKPPIKAAKARLMSLIILSWLFFFLYGPVEAALPVYVAHDLHASAGLLGAYWTSFGVGALVATLMTGTLRTRNIQRVTLLIVAGWGACLLPFVFAPVGVTLACFALGGLIYGPFIPLTYALFQSSTTSAHLPTVLAARSAIIMISTPLGPLVRMLGAAPTSPPPAPRSSCSPFSLASSGRARGSQPSAPVADEWHPSPIPCSQRVGEVPVLPAVAPSRPESAHARPIGQQPRCAMHRHLGAK